MLSRQKFHCLYANAKERNSALYVRNSADLCQNNCNICGQRQFWRMQQKCLSSLKSVPGRMAILITLFLVLVNIFNAQISSQPYAGKSASNNQEIATSKVNLNGEYLPFTENVTAISVWILFCIFFVFAALMAYARLDF